ncbi:GNAT family N-acetyltransferase [Citricoccus sp. GCM10030269]|uniref:GNAT family N-acetyltransferase n=1 Tax=Citricoccus sp. GCM10030269 TaxID=3273388 RepID=UPI00360A4F2F
MARILSRARPWSPSPDEAVRRASGGAVRVLSQDDTPALSALVAQDPVANCFVQSTLEKGRHAGPIRAGGSLFLGIFGPDRATDAPVLEAACWVGANVVPVAADAEAGRLFGLALTALRRRFASVYGPREAVLALWSELSRGAQRARQVRDDQPLMVLDGPPAVEPSPRVRPAVPEEFSAVLPACVAMFEEELGFSPLQNGAAQYRLRVEELIRNRWSLVDCDDAGRVRFKADLGVVSSDCTQIQGVWVDPSERGQGLAAPSVAAVVQYAQSIAPHVSLYVNRYNTAALRTYRTVGFDQVGTFATVLL